MIVWVLTLILCGIVFLSRKFMNYRWYWSKRGVIQIPALDGIKRVFQRKSLADMVQITYNQFPEERYTGFYQMFKPFLMVRDPELIKQTLVKDFDHFTDHFAFSLSEETDEPMISKSLFILKGRKWREMRATLSPAFTSSKMKAMFHLMEDCAKQFTRHFDQQDEDLIEVDLKDVFSRYANDVIGNCAFGVQCDSLEHKNNEFYLMGKDFTYFGFWRTIQLTILFGLPKVARFLGIHFIPKRVAQFFVNLVQETVDYREKNKIVRPDMIHLLMEARKGHLKYEENQNSLKDTGFATVEESSVGTATDVPKLEITMTDVAAQALIFFNAGFDPISTVMSFMGYELSLNPDIQQRLYKEIHQVIKDTDGKITYDVINQMKYLDMVTTESLRKWPSTLAFDGKCTSPYTIKPERDSEVPVNLTTDDILWIPVWGIHNDPQYYPNPDRFDPERFSDENKHNIKPCTYMPFGVGPRSCIGTRFALLEAKALFFHLLSKYELVVTEKTPIPLVLAKSAFAMAPEKNIIVGLKQRADNQLITTVL